MFNPDFFYQESGRINPIGMAVSYAVCIFSALLLGYVYSAAIIFIPIPYFNFFFTIGVGLLLGLFCRFFVRISQNRNKRSQLIFAVIVAFFANYFQWTVYILYAYSGKIPDFGQYLSNIHWVASPDNFFSAIAEINKVGLWSIFGVTFKGFGLTIIWIVEAAIIFIGPIIAIKSTKIYPYSESLSKWYPKYTLLTDFESVVAVNNLVKELELDPVQAIKNLGKGSGLRHTKIHLFYLANEEYQYLTFERVFVEGKGRGKENIEIVLNNFKVDKAAADQIMEEYRHKRERSKVF